MFKNTISQDLQDAIKKVMDISVDEALVGGQVKLDKNKNGKIDAHDFKLLKGQKAAPVKEEQTDEAHTMSHQAKTTMKHIPNASPAMKKAAKDIKPGIAGYRDRIAMLKAGGVKEEAKSEPDKDFKARQERLAAAAAETAKDPARLKRMMSIPGYSAAMGLANKTTTKEEVEELDELSNTTLGSYAKKATRDAIITRKIGADFEHQGKRAKSPGMKAASDELSQKYKSKSWQRRDGVDKAVDRLTKEDIEQTDEGWDDMMKDNKKKAADKGTGKFDRKELKPGVTQYTRKSKTFTDGGSDADLRKANRKSNEEVEADETIVIHNAFTVELKEAYSFGEYLTAAKNLVSDDDAVAFANAAFQAQDTSIFTEEYATAYIISKIQEHIQAGQVVSEPKYNTKDGEPYHEYTVTDKEGIHRSYIHHGTVK